jgi:hypothetical protein
LWKSHPDGWESVEATIRNLSPIIAYADKVTGSNESKSG